VITLNIENEFFKRTNVNFKELENKDYTFEYLNKLGIKAIKGPRKIAKEVSEKIK